LERWDNPDTDVYRERACVGVDVYLEVTDRMLAESRDQTS